MTPVAATNALIVSRPSDGGVSIEHVVVRAPHLDERLLERALAPDQGAERELGAGKVDRGDGEIGLAPFDHLGDRDLVDEHVEHRALDHVRVEALAHRQVALRVEVDEQHPVPHLVERDPEVEGRRRLCDPALLVRERDDAGLDARADHAGRRQLEGGLLGRGTGGGLDRLGGDLSVGLGDGLAHCNGLRRRLGDGRWVRRRVRSRRRSPGSGQKTDESHDHASFTAVHPTPSRAAQSSPSQ